MRYLRRPEVRGQLSDEILCPQLVDHRVEFSKWWVAEFKTIKYPAQGTVFDYFIDPETKLFTPWSEKIPKFELDPDIPLQVLLPLSSLHCPSQIVI